MKSRLIFLRRLIYFQRYGILKLLLIPRVPRLRINLRTRLVDLPLRARRSDGFSNARRFSISRNKPSRCISFSAHEVLDLHCFHGLLQTNDYPLESVRRVIDTTSPIEGECYHKLGANVKRDIKSSENRCKNLFAAVENSLLHLFTGIAAMGYTL